MSTRQAFKRLMTHRATMIRLQADASGSEADTVSVAGVACFFEYNRRRTISRQGEEVTANAVLFMPASVAGYDPAHDMWEFTDSRDPSRRLRQVNLKRIDDPRTGATHHYEIDLI